MSVLVKDGALVWTAAYLDEFDVSLGRDSGVALAVFDKRDFTKVIRRIERVDNLAGRQNM